MRMNAERSNIDHQQIVSAGGSSGGYLAAATATVSDFALSETASITNSLPNAVVLFNPALANKFPRVADSLSPTAQLKYGSVPTFVVHRNKDTVETYASAVAYCDKLKSLEGHCE